MRARNSSHQSQPAISQIADPTSIFTHAAPTDAILIKK
jgi:hypothetical protein